MVLNCFRLDLFKIFAPVNDDSINFPNEITYPLSVFVARDPRISIHPLLFFNFSESIKCKMFCSSKNKLQNASLVEANMKKCTAVFIHKNYHVDNNFV